MEHRALYIALFISLFIVLLFHYSLNFWTNNYSPWAFNMKLGRALLEVNFFFNGETTSNSRLQSPSTIAERLLNVTPIPFFEHNMHNSRKTTTNN